MTTNDDFTRRVSAGVSRWHMVDMERVEPPCEYTAEQGGRAVVGAFVLGVLCAVFVLAMFNLE